MNRRYWYAYIGGSETSILSYIKTTANPQSFCPGGSMAYAIYAVPNELDQNRPAIVSWNIQMYLAIGKEVNNSWPQFPKPYIYTKQSL